MNEPLFSIVTVTFNAASSIRATLESIHSQTFRHVEFIVIDGKSSDATLDIIREYEDLLPQVLSEKDAGIYDAMNKGLGLANGEWVIFLNAGDCLASPDTLARLSAMLDENTDLVYSDVVCNYGHFLKRLPAPAADHLPGELRKGMCICHNAVLFRTRLHKMQKYNLAYRIAADFDVILSMLEKGARVKQFPEPMTVIETGSGVSYLRQVDSLREHRRVLKAHSATAGELVRNAVAIAYACASQIAKRLMPVRLVYWLIRHKQG